MPPPRVTPWFNTLDVAVDVDIAAEVHAGTVQDFTPTAATHRGTLYGPGTLHVLGLPAGIDHYVRLVSLDGGDMSAPSEPVQTTAL